MPTQTYSTASLSFEYGSQKGFVSSNVAVTTMQEVITASQISLGKSYGQESEIPFIISINNNSLNEIKNIKIKDDLGSYSLDQGTYDSLFAPLSYLEPSLLYIKGKFHSNINPTISQNKIEFKIQSLPAKSNALIIYKTSVNEFSPLISGSKIKNTATIFADGINSPITAESIISVKDSADIKIIKNMSPNPVLSGEKITYNFSLYNYGNTQATNVILSDTFSPAPSSISVYLNSKELSSSDFSYINGNLTVPVINSDLSVSIPAANFIQDKVTGLISTEPGITTIVVTGQM